MFQFLFFSPLPWIHFPTPPSPPQKHLNKNLNFGPRTCLPSSVLAVAFETFPISNLGCIRAPLPACLVTIPIFMIRSSFPSIPSVAGRSCPDKAPPCIHFFLSIFFSLIIIFFPLHLLLLFYSPPRIVLDPTANIQLVYVSHLTLCKDKTPPSFKCEWVIAKIKNLKKNVKNKHQKKNGKENSLNKTK